MTQPPGSRRRRPRWLALTALLVILLALSLVGKLSGLNQSIQGLEAWITGLGPVAPAIFALLYALAVVLMIPGSALTLAAGALFGLAVGTIAVTVGANLGAMMAFLISRYLARDAVAARVERNPRFAAIDRAIGAGGWKIVALLRLSPAVPFNVQNYLYGLTRIPFWTCSLASFLAMLPGTLLFIYLGHAGRAGLEAASGHTAQNRTPAQWAFFALGLIATIAVTLYITRLARSEMKKQSALASLQPHVTEETTR